MVNLSKIALSPFMLFFLLILSSFFFFFFLPILLKIPGGDVIWFEPAGGHTLKSSGLNVNRQWVKFHLPAATFSRESCKVLWKRSLSMPWNLKRFPVLRWRLFHMMIAFFNIDRYGRNLRCVPAVFFFLFFFVFSHFESLCNLGWPYLDDLKPRHFALCAGGLWGPRHPAVQPPAGVRPGCLCVCGHQSQGDASLLGANPRDWRDHHLLGESDGTQVHILTCKLHTAKAPVLGDRTRDPLSARPLGDRTRLSISALKMELHRLDVAEILRFRSSCPSQEAVRKSFELWLRCLYLSAEKLWFLTKAFPGSEPENIWLHSSGLSISWIVSIIVLPTTRWSCNEDRRDFRDRNRVFVCSVQDLDHVPFLSLFGAFCFFFFLAFVLSFTQKIS